MQIDYQIRTAGKQEILNHLQQCNDDFIPPLNEKVDLAEYSKKIVDNAITFEAWIGPVLAGLIAAYVNDNVNHIGYITNVSVMKKHEGKGIASALMDRCIDFVRQRGFSHILLEVHKDDKQAIELYKKHGFVATETKGDIVVMKRVVRN